MKYLNLIPIQSVLISNGAPEKPSNYRISLYKKRYAWINIRVPVYGAQDLYIQHFEIGEKHPYFKKFIEVFENKSLEYLKKALENYFSYQDRN